MSDCYYVIRAGRNRGDGWYYTAYWIGSYFSAFQKDAKRYQSRETADEVAKFFSLSRVVRVRRKVT